MTGPAETEPRAKVSALTIGAVVLVAAVAPFVVVGGAAAAAGNVTVEHVRVADPGISDVNHAQTWTTHNWTVTVDSSVDQQLGQLKLDYSGTGTTFQGSWSASDVQFRVDGSQAGSISGVSTNGGDDVLTVSFGTKPSLSGNEELEVNLTSRQVANPSTAGTHTAAIELHDGSKFASDTHSFTTDSGTLDGTVHNATKPGQALGSAQVTISENGGTVATTTTDASGAYSTTVGPGSYAVSITRTHYNTSSFQPVWVSPDTTTTQKAALSPTGTIDVTVQDAQGNPLDGATVELQNTNTNRILQDPTGPSSNTLSKEVGTGPWEVRAIKSGHATQTWSDIRLGENQTKSHIFQLPKAGYINGTVTDGSGSSLQGLTVIAWDQAAGSSVDTVQTDANGEYNLTVAGGTYDVIAFDPNGNYQDTFRFDASASTGSTTTQDLTMAKTPPTGTLSGTVTDPNGNPATGVTVEAVDSSYRNSKSTQTDAQGTYSVSVPEGTYEVSTSSSSYADDVTEGVNVTGNQQTSADLQLSQAAYVEGTVTNASGAVPGAFVVAEGPDGQPSFSPTDGNGDYKITVAPGKNYSVTVWAQNQSAAPQTVSPAAGSTATADFTLQKTEITHSSVEVVDPAGVQQDKIGLSAKVASGMMMVQLLDETGGATAGMPNELEGLGVDENTEFRINVTVTNYNATTLLWGAKDVTWSTSQNESNPDATDVAITTKAVDLQGIQGQGTSIGPLMNKAPSDVTWPTGRNDRADLGWNRTVYFGVFDMGTAPADVRENFGGMTVTTNGQTFAPPRMVNDTLKVWVAGPHRTVDGNTHSGFYEATIPDAQLTEWGVDPANAEEELQVRYQGSDRNFQVTNLEDGVRIHLDIHYSAGSIEVAPDPNAGGSEPVVSVSNDDVEPTPTPTTTATPTPEPTSTPEPTATPTPATTSTPAGTSTPTATTTPAASTTAAPTPTATPSATAATPGAEGPGFGIVATLAALLALVALRGRRQS
jgi:PGF-CTERM protein